MRFLDYVGWSGVGVDSIYITRHEPRTWHGASGGTSGGEPRAYHAPQKPANPTISPQTPQYRHSYML